METHTIRADLYELDELDEVDRLRITLHVERFQCLRDGKPLLQGWSTYLSDTTQEWIYGTPNGPYEATILREMDGLHVRWRWDVWDTTDEYQLISSGHEDLAINAMRASVLMIQALEESSS